MSRRARSAIRATAFEKPAAAWRAVSAASGRPTALGQGEEAPPALIAEVVRAVRQVLLLEFPERRRMERQCERAAATLAAVLRKQKVQVQPISGSVVGDRGNSGTGAGHVWCRVLHPVEGCWYLLDVALAQFDHLLAEPAPEVVWGRYWQTLRRYGYLEDDPPELLYDPGDFDARRVQAVRSLLG